MALLRGRMLLACLTLAVTGALLGSSGAAARKGCKPGVFHHAGATFRTFCGPASATVHWSGHTYKFKGGNCQRTGKYLTINIGTAFALGPDGTKKPNYFGADIGRVPGSTAPAAPHDGTYSGASVTVTFTFHNKNHSVLGGTATLAGNRTRGTFSGMAVPGTAKASGTFRCS